MGPPHHFLLLASSATLTGCIPASTAPAPHPAPPSSTSHPAAPDYERQTVEVVGGDAQPTWTLRPVATNARAVTATSYTVRPGDTLRAIGDMTGAGSEAIAMENDLAPPTRCAPDSSCASPRASITGSGAARPASASRAPMASTGAK